MVSQAYTVELEAEITALKEDNERLQAKQVRTAGIVSEHYLWEAGEIKGLEVFEEDKSMRCSCGPPYPLMNTGAGVGGVGGRGLEATT